MLQIVECTSVRTGFGRGLLAVLAALLAAAPLWGFPAKGKPAPGLESLKLLQAPAGARASWASLKGKVVVLEFWATWCSPCVAGLPHFNQLVGSLDPAKFQFISIDDEEPRAIQAFLARKKMAGWVGVDASGRTFARYGVESRPTTIIIDASGNVVSVTQIDSVRTADLQAIAARKPVALKPAMEIVTASAPSSADAANAVFAVSLSKAPADAQMSMVRHPPTGTDLLGQTSDDLLTSVLDIFGKRIYVRAPLPEGRFDLRVNTGDLSQSASAAAVQDVVLAALHLQLQTKTMSKPALVLRSTDAAKARLSASASTHGTKRGYWHGGFLLMNGTMDDLAYVLGTGLETPVVNETGVDGRYDARFKAPANDLESVNAVLRQTMGLELVGGGQEASITVQELVEQERAKPQGATPLR